MSYPIATVDLEQINRNILSCRRPVILMVKADAYGLGVEKVVGATPKALGYGVATMDEGIKLRRSTDKPILVTTPPFGEACLEYALTPMVGDEACAKALPKGCKVHIKVNTGMNRFGVTPKFAVSLARYCLDRGLVVTGIATHYASADKAVEQNMSFRQAVADVERVTGRLLRHAEASSTCKFEWFDVVRMGLNAYQNAVTVRSTILVVRRVKAGDRVGYDGVYSMPQDGLIAVVAGGYADGFAKGLRGGLLRCRGRLHKIVAVCMDVILVHLACACEVGDEVILTYLPPILSPYELLTGLKGRTSFEYQCQDT